jgi:hypothetical protein
MITVALISYKIWAGHVARMGEKRGAYRVFVGNLRERDHLEDPGVNGG